MLPEETTTSNRQRAQHSTSLRRLNSSRRLSTSPSSSSSPRRQRPTPKPVKIFHKCNSEPLIFDNCDSESSSRSVDSDEGGWLCRVRTLDDVMMCTDISQVIASPIIKTGYQKDAKVLITVTVEGSPGPVKTLVKLGANVDDTIKLVVQKYGQEGRSPRLDKNAASSFDLYVSYFSLQSLDKSYAIGDVGTRSFYLRKGIKKSHECNMPEVASRSSDHEPIRERGSPSKQPRSPVVACTLDNLRPPTQPWDAVANEVVSVQKMSYGFSRVLEGEILSINFYQEHHDSRATGFDASSVADDTDD